MKVVRLSTTPIKGFALHHPASVEITHRGAVGDREFFLVDQDNALLSITKTGELASLSANYDEEHSTLSILERGVVIAEGDIQQGNLQPGIVIGRRGMEGTLVAGPWNHILSERLGRQVKLVKTTQNRNGSDIEPLSIMSSASIKALEESANVGPIDPRRFRMLIEVDGIEAHEEDSWVSQDFSIGSATIRAGGPIKRCAAVTRNPDSGVVDLKTLKLIGDYRGRQQSQFGLGFNFGIYASCVKPGVISVGDQILQKHNSKNLIT